ncbi:MAG: DNA polymerase IV [Inquilinus sp.]|nr:DNA polymerase IV [Inquilinus sp.]
MPDLTPDRGPPKVCRWVYQHLVNKLSPPAPGSDRASRTDGPAPQPGLCRDCATATDAAAGGARCPECHSPRLIMHRELHRLAIAHLDCDAFYATVEKRDRPELSDQPVIIGGGRRGVVAAACYVARLSGVRSAMPMFKALAACPKAVVIKPDMRKYAEIGRRVRELMLSATPLVEPISIDEAFLDLSGTEALHHGSPAQTCVRLVARIEAELGITISVGLSYNKFLAKLASDLDKPRGFAVIGRAEAVEFLAGRPVGAIWGVGKALGTRLNADGLRRIGDLRRHDEATLVARYGGIGRRLWRFAHGRDDRVVEPGGAAKSVSAETTFNDDIADLDSLKQRLWPLCERVATRLKARDLAARTVVLKLKTDRFRLLTRSHQLPAPTQLADTLYRTALPLLAAEAHGTRYRLIGIGGAELTADARADPADLLDRGIDRRRKVEEAIDSVRAKLGDAAIMKGRGFPGRR